MAEVEVEEFVRQGIGGEDGTEDEAEDADNSSRGDAESTNGGISPVQVINVSSHTDDA